MQHNSILQAPPPPPGGCACGTEGRSCAYNTTAYCMLLLHLREVVHAAHRAGLAHATQKLTASSSSTSARMFRRHIGQVLYMQHKSLLQAPAPPPGGCSCGTQARSCTCNTTAYCVLLLHLREGVRAAHRAGLAHATRKLTASSPSTSGRMVVRHIGQVLAHATQRLTASSS